MRSASLRPMPALLERLARDHRGVALIEFAFVLPVLLLAGLLGLETTNLVLAHMRVSRIASMVADNGSRVRDSIDETDIIELMQGAELAADTLDLRQNGRVILSAVQENAGKTGQWIRWQRCYGRKAVASNYGAAGKGKSDASLPSIGSDGRAVRAVSGSTVMLAELSFDYQPLITGAWGGKATTIHYESVFNVRSRPNTDPTNSSKLKASETARCTSPSFGG